MNNKEQFYHLYETIKRDGAAELLKWIESTDFFTAPASTRFHGSYEGGLCEHSVNVCKHLAILAKTYELHIPNETIAVCSLLHDLCKINMYKTDFRNAKNENGQWERVPYYQHDEQFNYGGHGSKSVFLIERYMRLTEEEAVAINCHMSCWGGDTSVGSAYEQYPIAWLTHVADEAATYLSDGKEV